MRIFFTELTSHLRRCVVENAFKSPCLDSLGGLIHAYFQACAYQIANDHFRHWKGCWPAPSFGLQRHLDINGTFMSLIWMVVDDINDSVTDIPIIMTPIIDKYRDAQISLHTLLKNHEQASYLLEPRIWTLLNGLGIWNDPYLERI